MYIFIGFLLIGFFILGFAFGYDFRKSITEQK